MSSLWTPSGEHTPGDSGESGPGPVTAPATGPAPEAELAAAEEMARMRAELAATPVVDIVANHVIGLWQLAILHLGLEGDRPPNLAEASLAIDAIAAIVDGLGDRMQDHAQPLRDALAQLRLAYVQVAQLVQQGVGGEGA